MIDALLLPLQHRMLAAPARWLVTRGISADRVTLAGLVPGLAVLPALACGLYGLALLLILANRLADGLDGAVARIDGPTDRGAFLDIVFDFAFYALVPLGFALADPTQNALPAAALIAAFMGTSSSFLAFAVIAERRGETTPAYPMKGIAYLGGLTEGTETIVFFIAMCLFPQAFPPLAWLFAVACILTMALRWHRGWHSFSLSPDKGRG